MVEPITLKEVVEVGKGHGGFRWRCAEFQVPEGVYPGGHERWDVKVHPDANLCRKISGSEVRKHHAVVEAGLDGES